MPGEAGRPLIRSLHHSQIAGAGNRGYLKDASGNGLGPRRVKANRGGEVRRMKESHDAALSGITHVIPAVIPSIMIRLSF